MKLKFLTSLVVAGCLLASTSAFALSEVQKTDINAKINVASATELASVAGTLLRQHCDCGASESISGPCISFIVNAAKAKLGPNASIAAVRNLVNELVLACPTKAALVVTAVGAAYPGMKANIAQSAQGALNTAVQSGQITQAQATNLSTAVNVAAGISTPIGGGRAGSLFNANVAAAGAAARTEFQRSNLNNYKN